MKGEYLKYFSALLLFGSNGVVAAQIPLSSYEIVLLRSFLGSLLLLGLFFLSGHRPAIQRYKQDCFFIALSGIAMAADWLLLFEAYCRIGVSLGMIINYCGPVIVIALSPFVFHERITIGKLLAVMLALPGAFLVSGQVTGTGGDTFGLLCAILSAFAYAAMVIFNKMAKQITGLENAAFQMLITFVAVFAFVICKKGISFHLQANSILPVLWLGLVNTGIGCFCYFSSIGELSAQTVAICGYLEPMSAVLMSAVILHETLLPEQAIGIGLILGGAVLGECCKRKGRIIA